METNEKFRLISEFLFGVTPTDEVISENAGVCVKLVENKLGDKYFEPFMLYISYPKKTREDKLREYFGEKYGALYSCLGKFDHINSLFNDEDLFALINLCTAPISFLRKLRKCKESRYAAYTYYDKNFEPRSAPRSIEMSNFLFAIIQGNLYTSTALRIIDNIN